jgi:uncharacterized protein YaiE (UPF0345 family)
MLTVNTYFNDTVKSIAFTNAEGKATVGVMEAGEYDFGTNCVEYMTIVSGALTVLLSAATEWKTYSKGETFIVPANTRFQLKVAEQTAYCCFYV